MTSVGAEWATLGTGLVLSAVVLAAVTAATPVDVPATATASPGGGIGDPPDGADAVLRDGSAHFVGQVLFTDAFAVGDDVDLERPGGAFVSDVPLRGDGSVLLNTSDVPPGDYVLTDNAGTSLSFTLAQQEYRVDAGTTFVRNGGDESETTLAVDSNRDGYTHLVTSPDLDAAGVRRVLGVGTVADADADGTPEVVVEGGTTFQRFSADFRGVPAGNYTLRFEVPDTGATATVTVEVGVYPPGEVTIEGDDPLRVQQTSGRFVGGTTTLPEGTTLRITVTNDGGQPFRRSAAVRVREGGTFGARFDFSGVPRGQAFDVTVRQGESVRDRKSGVVVAPARLLVSPSESPDGRTVTVDTAVVPDGGFVAVSTDEGAVLGASEYLDPGAYEDVAVVLDEPLEPGTTELSVAIHRDTDGDRTFEFPENATVDVRYRRSGVPVEKSTAVTIPGATPTATASPTATATATAVTGSPTGAPGATATATDSPAGPGASDGGGDGAAGFGPGHALLAVLVLVGVVAARRRSR